MQGLYKTFLLICENKILWVGAIDKSRFPGISMPYFYIWSLNPVAMQDCIIMTIYIFNYFYAIQTLIKLIIQYIYNKPDAKKVMKSDFVSLHCTPDIMLDFSQGLFVCNYTSYFW